MAENILIICRDVDSFMSVLPDLKTYNNNNIIIATDDLDLHKEVEKINDVSVVWLNQMQSIYQAAPNVIEIVKEINEWLKKQSKLIEISEDLLYWVQYVEGGDTTQRIQDAILETLSILALIEKYRPARIVLGASLRDYWEDMVAEACANLGEIALSKIRRPFSCKLKIRNLWTHWRPFVSGIYNIIFCMIIWLNCILSMSKCINYRQYIAIQLCSSELKHLRYAEPLLKLFQRMNVLAVAVTWGVDIATIKHLRKKGLKVAELEGWIPPHKVIYAYWRSIKGWRIVRQNLKSFLDRNCVNQYAAIVREPLMMSMRNFFLRDVAHRICLHGACLNYFAVNPPVAARFWSSVLIQGVIAFRATEKLGINLLSFTTGVWPYNLKDPYYSKLPMKDKVRFDILFCFSDEHKQKSISLGYSENSFFVCGFPLRKQIMDYKKKISIDNARHSLRILENSGLVVLVDLGGVISGYWSVREQSLLIETVCKFAEENNDVFVLLKPHPSQKSDILKKRFNYKHNSRIIWISGKASPSEVIIASDILLTKFSTLAVEAMLMDKPALCVLFDKEKKWAIYEDAVEYVYDVIELRKKLDLLRNKNYYKKWLSSISARQQAYINKHLPLPKIDENTFIVQTICNNLCIRGL